jgi:hypothetical protein
VTIRLGKVSSEGLKTEPFPRVLDLSCAPLAAISNVPVSFGLVTD